ncbi:MAG: tRNA (adenosine(37)-N6)-threonylcarbamoyltransferase complex dimerization subunit type 1 TsaB [Candidatus Omnitrophica bacterium]|nr:tRNA (adenosine(37)-N6)-threonylcarbamoyltransferase complex dimerization subunit type 1 TsaB [Candidatus Omnitrophota bacterium]
MNILVIENSTPSLSIALCKQGKIFQENTAASDASREIIPITDKLLNKAGLDINEINAFSVGLGPGSFTGLRIACSTVKGFHAALKKPIIGLSSFIAVAQEISCPGKKTVIITDAKKTLIYGAVYTKTKNRIKARVKPKLMPLEEFLKKFTDKDCIFCGESLKFKEGIEKIHPDAHITEGLSYPTAANLVPKSEEEYANKNFIDVGALEPLYLHPETCQIRKR